MERGAELGGLGASIEEFRARIRRGLDQAGFEQKRQVVEVPVDRVVVSHEEVEVRHVVATNKASEQVHYSHLRADYRARPRGGPQEVAGGAMLPRVPYGRADDRGG